MTAHEHDADDAPAAEAHAPQALPPAPAVRHITPAPEDFENPPAFASYIWPIFWCGLAGVLISLLYCYGWHDVGVH